MSGVCLWTGPAAGGLPCMLQGGVSTAGCCGRCSCMELLDSSGTLQQTSQLLAVSTSGMVCTKLDCTSLAAPQLSAGCFCNQASCTAALCRAGDTANVQRIAGQPVTACDGSLPFVLDDDAVATTFAEPLPSHSQRLLAQPLAGHQPPRRSPSVSSSRGGGAEPQGFDPERDAAAHAQGLAAEKAAPNLQGQGSAARQGPQGLSPHVAHLAVPRPRFGHKTSAGAEAGGSWRLTGSLLHPCSRLVVCKGCTMAHKDMRWSDVSSLNI